MPNRAQPGKLLREVRIDSEQLRANLGAARAAGFNEVDISADAYRLGAEFVTQLAVEVGLNTTLLPNGSADLIYGLDGKNCPIQLVGEVIRAKSAKAGTGVSYGYIHRFETDTNLALVGLGFCDGIPRAASTNFQATIANRHFAGVGRIAMDQCVLDTGDHVAKVGDEVEFFTPHFTISHWAEAAGILPQELLLHIGPRVERVYY